jgi:hypothetical protein
VIKLANESLANQRHKYGGWVRNRAGEIPLSQAILRRRRVAESFINGQSSPTLARDILSAG